MNHGCSYMKVFPRGIDSAWFPRVLVTQWPKKCGRTALGDQFSDLEEYRVDPPRADNNFGAFPPFKNSLLVFTVMISRAYYYWNFFQK